jgi:pimeloyl-ACP methyl ester carboxylesterase
MMVAVTAQAATVDDFIDFSLRDDTGTVLLPGRLYVPPESIEVPETPRPLILFMHGAGEQGTNNVSQVNSNIDNLLAEAKRRGAYLYAPQTNNGWDSTTTKERVNRMIQRALNDHSTDASRLYVTGLSLGGGGAWNMLSGYPQRFAAGVPIAVVIPNLPSPSYALNLVGQPVWAFHARDDGPVTARALINAILMAAEEPTVTFPPNSDPTDFQYSNNGLDLYYTEWATGGHEIWPRVYDTSEMYDWLFGQQRIIPRQSVHLPVQTYTVLDEAGDALPDGLGDLATDAQSAARRGIGELDSLAVNQLSRLVVKFELPETTRFRNEIERATLRLFLEDIEGTPTGPVSLFHSIADNDLTIVASHYEDASYTDTLLDLVGPAGEGGRYYDLDVTELVRADYAADGDHPLSAFRLQVSEAMFVDDDQSNRFRFTMPGVETNYPELLVVFVPEFGTLGQALWAILYLAVRGCRRQSGHESGTE